MSGKAFIVSLLVVILPVISFPQDKTGEIHGTVTLEDGSAIPGVAITLNGNKGVIGKFITISSEKGVFRFLSLPPGKYRLRCELEGFKTVNHKNIEVKSGKSVTLKIIMIPAPIIDWHFLPWHLIDFRQVKVEIYIDRELIRWIPTARNPWTLLSEVPGVMIDRVDIGGAESGQQSNFLALGSDPGDTTWHINGANITNPAAAGSASEYLDVNTYDEMQVTLGANDIRNQTGGIQLNFISKGGGNRVSGDFFLYVEDKSWEMKPKSLVGSPTPAGIHRLYQYGVNIGGPIIKDRLLWFGSYGVQDIHKRSEANYDDATWLVSNYGKLHLHWDRIDVNFSVFYHNKKKSGRPFLSPLQQDRDSLWEQERQGHIFYSNLTYVPNNYMFLNVKAAYWNSGNSLDPLGADKNPETGHSEGNEFKIIDGMSRVEGAAQHDITHHHTLDFAMDVNYYNDEILGSNHEIRFGVDYFSTDTTSQTLTPNQRILYIDRTNPAANYMALVPDGFLDVNFKRISLYLQDTISWSRLTASIGLRYDKEQNKVNPMTLPYFTWHEPGSPHHGERLFADTLKEYYIRGFKVPVSWSFLSPRISLSYDLTGDLRNVLKLSAARYMSQGGNTMANHYIPDRALLVNWTDANHDEVPQFDEVGHPVFDNNNFFSRIDPVTGLNRVEYDPDYNTPILDELVLMFEKVFSEDLAMSIAGFYKKQYHLVRDVDSRGGLRSISKGIMPDGSIEDQNNWVYVGTTKVGGTDVPTFQPVETPIGDYYYNPGKAYNRFLGLQLVMKKRLSDGWLANLSFTLQDWKRFRFEEETLDLNNFDFFNGGAAAAVTSGSGLEDAWVHSRWMVKFTGLYQLPRGIYLTAFFQAREGYPQPLRRQVLLPQGTVYLYRAGKKAGDERLPIFWMLNLGLEKTLRISDSVRATLVVDWYNVSNNQIPLKYNLVVGADNPGEPVPTMWSNPGVFQFGFRLHF